MKALRGLFFFAAAVAACFSDNGVQRGIMRTARAATAVFTVLFVIAEAMELMI